MMKWEENCHDPYTSSVSKKPIQTNFVLSVKTTTEKQMAKMSNFRFILNREMGIYTFNRQWKQ